MFQTHKIINFNKKAESIPGCIRFDKGSAGFPNKHFLIALRSILKDIKNRHLGYAPAQGLLELRKKISNLEYSVNKRKIAPNRILITQGALPGLFLSLFYICKPGDEVLINNVHFEGFDNLLNSIGVKEKLCDFESSQFIKAAVGPKTKAILFNSPENPTGKIYSLNKIKQLAKIAKRNNLWIISDEVNNQIVYEKPYQCIPGQLSKRLISLNSFSKNYFLQGLRLGWLIGPSDVVSELSKLQSSFQVSVDIIAQLAAVKMLDSLSKPEYLKYLKILKSKRDLMAKYLKETNLRFSIPAGGTNFFVAIDTPSEKFSRFLLKKYKTASIPGIYFGKFGEGFLRLGFGAVSNKEIERGCKKIKIALENFSISKEGF